MELVDLTYSLLYGQIIIDSFLNQTAHHVADCIKAINLLFLCIRECYLCYVCYNRVQLVRILGYDCDLRLQHAQLVLGLKYQSSVNHLIIIIYNEI